MLKDVFSKEETLYTDMYIPKNIHTKHDLKLHIRVIYSDLHRYDYYQDVNLNIPSYKHPDEVDSYFFDIYNMKINQTHPSDDIFGK